MYSQTACGLPHNMEKKGPTQVPCFQETVQMSRFIIVGVSLFPHPSHCGLRIGIASGFGF